MALFKRADLKAKGLTDDQIEWLMTEAGRSLAANYVTKSDSDAAVAAAKAEQPEPQDPTKSEAYLQLAAKAAKLEAFQGAEFAGVKAPYKDMVWGQLNHDDGHKPYAEQLATIRETMPDLFAQEKQPDEQQPPKPSFGGPTGGGMPSGNEVPGFGDLWGFVPKK